MFFGTLFSISSQHWLSIWGGLELNIIGFLPILVYEKTTWESESAVKYFIVQALGSRLLIIGRLWNYRSSLSWEIINLINRNYFSIGVIRFGLIIKLGIAPFHMWVPSVISGLPWGSCMLLATWQKVAPLILLFMVLSVSKRVRFTLLVLLVGSFSAIIGGVGGINQTQIRALIAYSSIGHIGWLLIGILGGFLPFCTYLLIYITISLCLFSRLWQDNLKSHVYLNGLRKVHEKKAGVLVSLLSLGGLPPMLGFTSKLIVTIRTVCLRIWARLLALILGSLIRLYYYLVLFFNLFSSKGNLGYRVNLKGSIRARERVVYINLLGGLRILSLVAITF